MTEHAPHHAPADYIAKYKGRFDQGWDSVREEILARQKIDEDPSETVDLAERYPEKLANLKGLFQQEALKYNVYPLNDSTTGRLKATIDSFNEGVSHFEYMRDDGHIHEALSPPVKNKSHSITAKLVGVKSEFDGAIVAAGGRFGGYSLFIKDRHLFYAHNFVGSNHYEVVSSVELPNGDVEVRFDFEKTGEFQGVGKLYIENRLVGQGTIAQTTPIIYSIYDTFDIGEDSGSPVSNRYDSPFIFQGGIEKVEVDLK